MSEPGRGNLSVLDVADALQNNYAFISGGRSRRSFPLITFPECISVITDEQHKNVVLYLTSIPSRAEIELGFVVIIDRRLDKWSSVKTVLLRVVDHFPALVQKIYVLQPSSFLQKTFSDSSLKFLKDDVKFKILVLSTAEELHNHIDRDQLTPDLGGTLLYDHQEWIQHRAALEKFASNVHQITETLSSLCLRLQETEFPNDVAQTEALLADHAVARQEVSEDLKSTVLHGEALRDCFAAVAESVGNEKGQLPLCRLANIDAIERQIAELKETTEGFGKFWSRHERRLDQCLQLRKFEEKFRLLQFSCERHLASLETMVEVGDSFPRVNTLLAELKDFENKSKDAVSAADQLRVCGEKFIDADHYAVDCIRPKCLELERISMEYKEKLKDRYHLLHTSRDLHSKIEKASKWCRKGIELLTSQSVEQQTSEADVQSAIKDIETLLEECREFHLDNPAKFHSQFEGILTPQVMDTVQQVLLQMDDVQTMCNKRLTTLRLRFAKPVRTVPTFLRELSSPSSKSSSSQKWQENSGDEQFRKFRPSHKGKGRLVRSLSTSTFYEVINPEPDCDPVINGNCNFNHGETAFEKRIHVMQELINTERTYVEELRSILKGYMSQIDCPDMAKLLPVKLQGKKDILFGNLEQIHNFHENIFLRDLEECRNTPTLVGRCFMARKDEFQIYVKYCQNKLSSEELRRTVGDQNAFFRECQKNLGHHLPLSAYLLKPVQRIASYQLFLREMLKYSDGDEGNIELKESLDAMHSIVKHANDIMHQISITGFDGNLAEQGELLMQGSFNIWTEHKKDRLRELWSKPTSRHIFLYERTILFCKKKDALPNTDKVFYIFKNALPTSSFGLTEMVKGDKKKFELWLADRSQVYIIQAVSVEVKTAWVIEIKKVLQKQFERIRENSRTNSGSSNGKLPMIDISQDDSVSSSGDADSEVAVVKAIRHPRRSRHKSASGSWKFPHHDNHSHSIASDAFLITSPCVDAKKPISVSLCDLQDTQVSAQYVAVGNYVATESDELTIHEGELIQLVAVGSGGWWQVTSVLSQQTGWVPARFLDAKKWRSTYSLQSIQSSLSSSSGKVVAECITASQLSLCQQ